MSSYYDKKTYYKKSKSLTSSTTKYGDTSSSTHYGSSSDSKRSSYGGQSSRSGVDYASTSSYSSSARSPYLGQSSAIHRSYSTDPSVSSPRSYSSQQSPRSFSGQTSPRSFSGQTSPRSYLSKSSRSPFERTSYTLHDVVGAFDFRGQTVDHGPTYRRSQSYTPSSSRGNTPFYSSQYPSR